jgi:hypothetical protein
MVINLDRLALYEGTVREGGYRKGWSVNTVKIEPRAGRSDRSQTSQAQPSGNKKWRYACSRAMWLIDPLLSSGYVNNGRSC